MAHPYKTYTIPQFVEEEKMLKEKLRQAKIEKSKNHIAIYTRKIEIVRSFMLNPADFQQGDLFELIEDPDHLFEINEIKGVFAWGYKINKVTGERSLEEEGFLLAMLGQKTKYE
ncbi:DUF1811 family protein [Aciduricibacillus chroicocephali]|uniref:DUF1811 family protein n=1 Tax=Aciduricibacillus chroicocephali TaxID=3054939 RepID=A0ABY9KUQ4_9BACI|nr:DUF1811 family protein [Bacillaceae bacterium 44XB]